MTCHRFEAMLGLYPDLISRGSNVIVQFNHRYLSDLHIGSIPIGKLLTGVGPKEEAILVEDIPAARSNSPTTQWDFLNHGVWFSGINGFQILLHFISVLSCFGRPLLRMPSILTLRLLVKRKELLPLDGGTRAAERIVVKS